MTNLPPMIRIPESLLATFPLEAQYIIRALEIRVAALEQRVHELEIRLSKDSSNSHKPPSSDGFNRKTKSQRKKSGRSPGGQPGHGGNTLKMVANPDHVSTHRPPFCVGCQHPLHGEPGTVVERRQVVDIPCPSAQVTEHQIESVGCPLCKRENVGTFPPEAGSRIEYGPNIKAFMTYLLVHQMIPFARAVEIAECIFGCRISVGSLYNFSQECHENLVEAEDVIRGNLIGSAVVSFDETGIQCEKDLNWLHVASTSEWTLLGLHEKRGQEGMKALGVLPDFKGTAVHDHWKSYFTYEGCRHGLCNAHHLRELTFLEEVEKEPWAKTMKALLLEIEKAVGQAKEQRDLALTPESIANYEKCYESILESGFELHTQSLPVEALIAGKRGRKKQRPGKNLLDRLSEKRGETLAFMYDFAVPFTNNQGERDIRMNKIKQKISGCFRSREGAESFFRIRSYISTVRKRSWNPLAALRLAFQNQALVPILSATPAE